MVMKKNMCFKYVVFFLLAFAAGNMTSCNDDDFLIENTESSYSYANAFSVSSQVNDCLTEMYRQHKSVLFAQDAFLYGIGTDIIDVRYFAVPTLSNFSNWSSTFSYPQTVFNNFYGLIAQANLVLYGAEQVAWSNESDKIQVIAQARFMRGYAYMNLAELYGGVPIVADFSEVPKFDYQRASREDTYVFTIGELEAAAVVLPEHQTPGRVGKGVAYHYLAEAYLALATIQNNNAANLDKSIAAADEVVKRHALMRERFGSRANPASTNVYNSIAAYYPDGDVFFDLFQRGNLDYEEGNTESLWVDQNNFAVFEKYGETNSSVMLPRFSGPVMRSVYWKTEWVEPGAGRGPWTEGILKDEFNLDMGISAYVGGRGVNGISPTYHARNTIWINGENDIRNSAANIRRNFKVLDPNHSLYGLELNEGNIQDYASDGTFHYLTGAIYTKWCPVDDWGYDGLTTGKDNRTYLFSDTYFARLAETYLLRAEAKLRKGDLSGAAADINELRARAKAPLVSPADVTIDYILDERIRELYIEERRWNTLLRMGGNIPNDRIVQHAKFIVDNPKWSGTLGSDFLFPIPQSFIDSNLDAVIEQNSYWK
jgi:hypothetical protein